MKGKLKKSVCQNKTWLCIWVEVEQIKQECWLSAFVGKTGCSRIDDKESLTLTGTEDCLIV